MNGWGSRFFFPHEVRVRDIRPGGGLGPTFAPPRTLRAEVRDEQRLVRTADGEQVVSSSRVTVELAAEVQAGSMVTVWPGKPSEREAVVLAVEHAEDDPPLPSFLVLSLE